MNVQEYIESGAIEACIMGFGSESEWQELIRMASLYPEVKAEKDRLELFVENKHLSLPVIPPANLKERIFSALPFNEEEEDDDDIAPVVELPATTAAEKPTDERPKVVPIVPTPKPVKWLQRALAISAVLLMGSLLLNFYFYAKSVTTQKEYDALVVQQNSLLAKNSAMQASFEKLKDPGMKPVVMNATPGQPGSMATVYWDDKTKDVYLLVNNLPKPAADKQYQLWAIVDGKPVDAGMVSERAGEDILQKMKNIPDAQAFAITLEKKGGSPTPNMEAMYVVGKV